jgi:hypothetical protein
MPQNQNQAGSPGEQKATSSGSSALTAKHKEQLGLKWWQRVSTHTSQSTPKVAGPSGNPAADAAAQAIAEMLKSAYKPA